MPFSRNPILLPENLYAHKCSKVTWLPQHQLTMFWYACLYVTFIPLVAMTYPELRQWWVGIWHQILQAYTTSVMAICMIFVQTYWIFKTSYSSRHLHGGCLYFSITTGIVWQGCSQPQSDTRAQIMYIPIHFMMANYWHAALYVCILKTVVWKVHSTTKLV